MGRISLNPCDYFFLGQHQLLTRKSPEGNIAYMMLDVEGHIEPELFRKALARAMALHPSSMGRLRFSIPLGRPFWKIPGNAFAAAERFAAMAHEFHDFRSEANWEQRVAGLYPTGSVPDWNRGGPPQVRFEQYALPDGRTRIIFRWPHFLMDADGAQWFLLQIGRQKLEDLTLGGSSAAEYPDGLCPDDRQIDLLVDRSFGQRVRLFRRGMSAQQLVGTRRLGSFVRLPARPFAEHQVIHRNWTADETLEIQEAAKHGAPSGPALYARYAAACVMRALDRLFREHNVESEVYRMTLPLRAGISKHDVRLFAKRPVPGNYLVSPVLCGRRDRLADKQTIGEDIFKQLQEYLGGQGDISQWAMMWAASLIHGWLYRVIFKLPLEIGEFSSGFSYYGEIAEPVRSLLGARVLNLWGGGPTTTPPALNPVFSKFDNRLNFTLTFDRQVITDEVARRYVDLIEEELFECMVAIK